MKARLITAALAAALIVAMSAPAWALFIDFEAWADHDQEAIGSLISGLTFTTAAGGDWYFGYIGPFSQSGVYNYAWKSDNGKQDTYWDYFMSGDVAAYVTDIDDVGVISFGSQAMSSVSVGYSIANGFDFTLEAYDAGGNMLGSAVTGGPNCREAPQGDGLAYLTISQPGISYVKVYGDPASGGYWVVDNITASPSTQIPEPFTCAYACIGLIAVARARRRSRQ